MKHEAARASGAIGDEEEVPLATMIAVFVALVIVVAVWIAIGLAV